MLMSRARGLKKSLGANEATESDESDRLSSGSCPCKLKETSKLQVLLNGVGTVPTPAYSRELLNTTPRTAYPYHPSGNDT